MPIPPRSTGITVPRAMSRSRRFPSEAMKSPGPWAEKKSNWPRNCSPVTRKTKPSQVVGWLYGRAGFAAAAIGM